MTLSQVNVNNNTNEASILCECLLALGVKDQEVEIKSNPYRMGDGRDSRYYTGTSLRLTETQHEFLGYVSIASCWGANLIKISGQDVRLIECATSHYDKLTEHGTLGF